MKNKNRIYKWWGQLQLYYLVGEFGLGNMSRVYGTWCQHVWCELWGRNGIVVHLRILRYPWINWNPCYFILSLICLRLGVLHIVLPFYRSKILLDLPFDILVFFMILCVHQCEHKVFFIINKFCITYPKKEKGKINHKWNLKFT